MEFQQAIRLDPSDPDAHYQLGRAYRAMGRDEEAREKLQEAQRLYAERKALDEMRTRQRLDSIPQ